MNLLVVPLGAMERYSSKLIKFDGATIPQKTQIYLRSVTKTLTRNIVNAFCILTSSAGVF
jgi:hypothetical protein